MNNKGKTTTTFSKLSIPGSKQLFSSFSFFSPIEEKTPFLKYSPDDTYQSRAIPNIMPHLSVHDTENDENTNITTISKSHSATDLRIPNNNKTNGNPRSSSHTNVLNTLPLNRHPNRLSTILSGDNINNNNTKASTIAAIRKNSLPPMMKLFPTQEPSLPPYLTLAEFKRLDNHPRKQRAILVSLQRQDDKLRKDGIIKEMNKDTLKGKKGNERKISKIKDTTNQKIQIPTIKRGGSGVSLKFLGIKKGKKKTDSVLLNNLVLAIRDHKTSDAIAILSHIPNKSLKKKKNHEANKAFLLAMTHRLEDVALAMYERGIPRDVNSPILFKKTKNTERNNMSELKLPSYFILAVKFGLYNLVRIMLKRANMNQTWFGLSPLIIAISKASQMSMKIDSEKKNIIKLLLDNGADPSQGLPYEQFNTLRKLKAKHNTKILNESFETREVLTKKRVISDPYQFYNNNKKKDGDGNYYINSNTGKMIKSVKNDWVFPLDIAAVNGNIDIVKMLLIRGNTTLHRAARSGHTEMVFLLLRLGADIDAKGENDWTPLHEAISKKHLELCLILIAAGANVKLKSKSGQTFDELGLTRGLTKEDIDRYTPDSSKFIKFITVSFLIEDNLEAQKLLAAAIAHNNQYRFDDDQKRKLEMLEDIVQQSPSKASHNLNIASVPHPELSAEENDQTSDNALSEQRTEPLKKKPGRKPLNNTPSSKRKAQNRAAQRAFRERKERYVKELETKITELESLSAKSAQENQQLKTLVEQLQTENFILKQTSFSFEFPLTKTEKSTTLVDKNITDLMSSSSSSSSASSLTQQQHNTTTDTLKSLLSSINDDILDPYTPPSSGTSDEEPSSPKSSDSIQLGEEIFDKTKDSSTNKIVTSLPSTPKSIPTTTSTPITTANTTKNVLSEVLQSSSINISHSPKPQNAKEFCEKFTNGICLQDSSLDGGDGSTNSDEIITTTSSNTTTDSNRLSSFTEYRDPTPFTPNIDNPFSESAPLPPLFEENFQNFGSFAPMATPLDERKNPFNGQHSINSFEESRNNQKFLSCNKVWERIQQHPKFDDLEGDEIDQLCNELKSKAKCSGNGPVVPEEELEA
ncbi:1227_t:CDS:10 [Diversispora eburnea]|uniref:1227_t:CDS:1 n=1 Tax=Diversispora eburnea TaxID=1213867 RepID=A0A9N8W3A7_9GLOM|nr:1227_t:CDS:10 [Diversispora eburnea]